MRRRSTASEPRALFAEGAHYLRFELRNVVLRSQVEAQLLPELQQLKHFGLECLVQRRIVALHGGGGGRTACGCECERHSFC